MNHKVHQISGVVIAQGTLLYHHVPAFSWNTIGVIMCGYFAAMIPDLDKPGSFFTVHQPFRAISEGLSHIGVPHRGPTHSLPMLLFIYLLFQFVIPLPDVYVWAITLGYFSHIFLDLFNAAGVMLLFPWRFDFKLLPSFMAVSSDDHSIGQALVYLFASITFYALLANELAQAFGNMPFLGGKIEMLRTWGVSKTEFIWEPVVKGVYSSVKGVQSLLHILKLN